MPAVISSEATMYQVELPTVLSLLSGDGNQVRIPGGITDLSSFRRWAHSRQFPETGRIDLLGDVIWVDLAMEDFLFHNLVKTEISAVLHFLGRSLDVGNYVSDRMRISLPRSPASVEPDGMFILYETFRRRRVREVRSRSRGVREFEGTPDLVLEIVSPSSEHKDYNVLPKRYARGKVPELWRVDVREGVKFEILRLAGREYEPAAASRGWLRSEVLGRSFRLVVTGADPLGRPKYSLEVRD